MIKHPSIRTTSTLSINLILMKNKITLLILDMNQTINLTKLIH